MRGNLDDDSLVDVSSSLFSAFLQVEGAKPTQVDVLTLHHCLFDGSHYRFHGNDDGRFFNARFSDDLIDDFGFGHKESYQNELQS